MQDRGGANGSERGGEGRGAGLRREGEGKIKDYEGWGRGDIQNRDEIQTS